MEKVKQLIFSDNQANTILALQLLQSQHNFSLLEALHYIVEQKVAGIKKFIGLSFDFDRLKLHYTVKDSRIVIYMGWTHGRDYDISFTLTTNDVIVEQGKLGKVPHIVYDDSTTSLEEYKTLIQHHARDKLSAFCHILDF